MAFSMALRKFISPEPAVAGLEITTQQIRYCRVEGSELIRAAVVLDRGILEDGDIKERGKFLNALRKLRLIIPGARPIEHVVVVVPPHKVVTAAFSTAVFQDSDAQAEAIELNLRSAGPTEGMYTTVEKLRTLPINGGRVDFISAYVPQASLDQILEALKAAQFNPVAVEFPAASLARLIRLRGSGLDWRRPYGVLDINNEGIQSVLLVGGLLQAQEFVSWATLKEDFGGVTIREHQIQNTVINFLKRLALYSGRFGEEFQEVIVTAPVSLETFLKSIEKNSSLKILPLAVAGKTDLPSVWAVAAGAALRGSVPRSEDNALSFNKSSDSYYRRDRWGQAALRWRAIAVGAVGAALLLALVGDALFLSLEARLNKRLEALSQSPGIADFNVLQVEAEEFNRLLQIVVIADSKTTDWASVLNKLAFLGRASRVNFEKISLGNEGSSWVEASALSESAAIDFKNELSADSQFQNVVLPLSDIATTSAGVAFTIKFDVLR